MRNSTARWKELADAPTANPSVILLFHIEKTGGSAVMKWLKRQLHPPARLTAVFFLHELSPCFFGLHADLFPQMAPRWQEKRAAAPRRPTGAARASRSSSTCTQRLFRARRAAGARRAAAAVRGGERHHNHGHVDPRAGVAHPLQVPHVAAAHGGPQARRASARLAGVAGAGGCSSTRCSPSAKRAPTAAIRRARARGLAASMSSASRAACARCSRGSRRASA